ncbi:MAG: serine/threonine protein kinase, partial [Polyangiaceae bacterium]
MPSNRRWGQYEAICELANGGMASVHLARRVGSEGDSGLVAVKVLHGHLQDDEEHRALFRRESELIAHIRHPNVASLIEFG